VSAFGRFEQAANEFLGVSDLEWRARYIPDIANVRVALDWSLTSSGDPAIAVALAGASGPVLPPVPCLRPGHLGPGSSAFRASR